MLDVGLAVLGLNTISGLSLLSVLPSKLVSGDEKTSDMLELPADDTLALPVLE
jgi:hypothetical protein